MIQVTQSVASTNYVDLEGLTDRPWEQPQLRVGDFLGDRYRVLAHIGSGGMGEVYEVEHTALGRHFAAKVLRRPLSAQPPIVSRFHAEVRAMARLRSDYVAQIVDTGMLAEGIPYFVMQRLSGSDLKTILGEVGSLPPYRALGLIADACRGLKAVHAAGLVHRDIKPSNLFVTKTDSGNERCILLDFGVTKSDDTTHTCQGQLVGTLQYMAPEQLESAVANARTDLYSLGVVLYQCLVGQPPHAGDTLERILYSIMKREPTSLRKQRPEISESLSQLVCRAIARRPADRYVDADAMLHALLQQRAGHGGASLASESPTIDIPATHVPMVWYRRHATNLILPLLGLVVGIASTCFTLLRVGARTSAESSTVTSELVTGALDTGTAGAVPATGTAAIEAQQVREVCSVSPLDPIEASAAPTAPIAPTATARESSAQSPRPKGSRRRPVPSRIDPANPYDE